MTLPERIHSKLGASSAYRWIPCPGSVALCETMPKSKDNVFSIGGTNAHTLAEKVLREPPNANYYVRNWKEHFDFEVTQEMADHVQSYVDYVRVIKNSLPNSELLIEHKFHLVKIHPDLFGTCDAVVLQEFGELHVFDLKYGVGIVVDVEDNEQLMYYALGALELGDFSKVTIHICQPRAYHEEGGFRSQSFHVKELVQFGKFLKQRALETEKPNAPLQTGEHCRYCAASPRCPALYAKALATAQTDFDAPVLPEIERLTDEQITKVIQFQKLFENWFAAVKKYALEEVLVGRKIGGLKLVAGRGSRSWTNYSEAEKILGDKFGERAFERSLLSVAQAEKVLGKDVVKGLFSSFAGNPTIAHESDKRHALPSAKDDFGKIEEISEDDF